MRGFRFQSEASGNCYIFKFILFYFLIFFLSIPTLFRCQSSVFTNERNEDLKEKYLKIERKNLICTLDQVNDSSNVSYLSDFPSNQDATQGHCIVRAIHKSRLMRGCHKNAWSLRHSSYWGASGAKP